METQKVLLPLLVVLTRIKDRCDFDSFLSLPVYVDSLKKLLDMQLACMQEFRGEESYSCVDCYQCVKLAVA